MRCTLIALLIGGLLGQASAASLVTADHHAATVFTDYSAPGLISFDIDFGNLAPVRLDYRIEAGDLTGPLAFNAVVRNFSGEGFEHVTFSLSNARFDDIGTVARQFGTHTLSLSNAGRTARIAFDLPEYLDVAIGNPLGVNGQFDWRIDNTGLLAGDTLSIAVAVPEPETWAMLLAGLGLVGMMARRRLS